MSTSLRMRTAFATVAAAGLLLAGSATASAGESAAAGVAAAPAATTPVVTEIGGETPFFRDAFYCNLLPWLC